MKRIDSTLRQGRLSSQQGQTPGAERRRALIREMVAGAILPGLLAKKDAGFFDRGPNVVRLTDHKPDR